VTGDQFLVLPAQLRTPVFDLVLDLVNLDADLVNLDADLDLVALLLRVVDLVTAGL